MYVGGGGGKRYVKNVCMYAALFRLYSGTITQTARRRAHTGAAGKASPKGPGVEQIKDDETCRRSTYSCAKVTHEKRPLTTKAKCAWKVAGSRRVKFEWELPLEGACPHPRWVHIAQGEWEVELPP